MPNWASLFKKLLKILYYQILRVYPKGKSLELLAEILFEQGMLDAIFFAGFKNIVGGEMTEYTKLQAQSREQAMQRMIDDAKNLNADATINIRFTT